MTERLTEAARRAALEMLPNWRALPDRDAIARTLTFTDFDAAFAFMTRVALIASRHDHHPDWHNVYNRVDLVLSTHDAGGLTNRDIELARAIDAVAAAVSPA
ncbi:4a-hydroxytetrahydrobiopterin dehydratase [Rhodopseudomonas pseudopalustris]|uniref:4a-hydroxytetrahydrobiopterin dehydratase n=1 Tax=Rhodopseudomonas pseudopalustris TaxID=1513892 RepID=UPI000C9F3FCF